MNPHETLLLIETIRREITTGHPGGGTPGAAALATIWHYAAEHDPERLHPTFWPVWHRVRQLWYMAGTSHP